MANEGKAHEITPEKNFIEKANKVIPGSDKGVDIGMNDGAGAGATASKGELEFTPDRSDGIGQVGEDGLEGLADIKGEDSPTPTFDTDLAGLAGGLGLPLKYSSRA